jgi:hypothetical protein
MKTWPLLVSLAAVACARTPCGQDGPRELSPEWKRRAELIPPGTVSCGTGSPSVARVDFDPQPDHPDTVVMRHIASKGWSFVKRQADQPDRSVIVFERDAERLVAQVETFQKRTQVILEIKPR